MKNYASTTAIVAVIATLAACGGGGGGDSTPPDFTTKYVGAWKTGCYTTGIVKDASTNGNAHVTDTITLTRVDESNMTAAFVKTVYASADTSCAGTAIGTIERTGLSGNAFTAGASGIKSSNGPNKIKIDGTAKLDTNTVEQISTDTPALNSSSSTGTTTAGRISINLADFQSVKEKNIVFQTGNKFTLGQASVSAYPTALGTTSAYIYTKQTSAASAGQGAQISNGETAD